MFERHYYDRSYFIENNTNPSFFEWMRSKGTNYTCYMETISKLNDTQWDNMIIEKYDKIISALLAPCSFYFTYWSLLLFILHKFDFRKPVLKIILGHLVIRCMGNVLENFGSINNQYFYNKKVKDEFGKEYYVCETVADSDNHPFRWFLTRQIGTICWYIGEIIADWYPLLRTKAIVKKKKMYSVYFTCALFNFSKILLIFYHLYRNPTKLYNLEDGTYKIEERENYREYYWGVQLTVILTSIIYECSVFFTLKKCIFEVTTLDMDVMKKFKVLSEFRILSSSLVAMVCLPFICVFIVIQYYYYYFRNPPILIENQLETMRQAIANVQYFMIFIDQILLICSSYDSKLAAYSLNSDFSSNFDYTYKKNNNYNNNNNNNNMIGYDDGKYKNSNNNNNNNNNNDIATRMNDIKMEKENYLNSNKDTNSNHDNQFQVSYTKPFKHFVTDLSMVNKNDNHDTFSFKNNITNNNNFAFKNNINIHNF